eukprot:s232_g3.t1
MYRPGTPLLVASLGASLGLMVAWWQSRRSKVRIAKSIYVDGLGEVAVKQQRSGGKIHVTLDWKSLLGIPFELPFCSAVVTDGGTIYVSGSIGAKRGPDGKPMIVPGGPEQEAIQTLRTIEASLKACGAGLEHVTMVHAFLVDYSEERFQAMNKGYFEVWGSRPLPARICTGTDHVGLNGAVEMDAVAQL